MELSNNEKRMLKALRSRPDEPWGLDEVLAECGWDDQAHVAGAGLGLAENGLVGIETSNQWAAHIKDELQVNRRAGLQAAADAYVANNSKLV